MMRAEMAHVAYRHRRGVGVHSMILSARARRLSGIVTPSNLLVLRLMRTHELRARRTTVNGEQLRSFNWILPNRLLNTTRGNLRPADAPRIFRALLRLDEITDPPIRGADVAVTNRIPAFR